MIVDEPTSTASLRQFASQVCHTPKSVRQSFENMFKGDQSDDFYRGLLAGLAASHVLNTNSLSGHVPHLIAFVAEKMEQKEIA